MKLGHVEVTVFLMYLALFFARTFSCRGQTLIPARCRMRFSWIEFVRREARTKERQFSMSLSVHYPCKLSQLNINKHPLCVPACVPARELADRKFWCNKIADQNVNAPLPASDIFLWQASHKESWRSSDKDGMTLLVAWTLLSFPPTQGL